MHTTYLSLGTNLGNKEENLQRAIQQITKRIGPVKAQSSFIETEPWGFQSCNKFLNAVICVETALLPYELLHETQSIERDMGRKAKTCVTGDAPKYQDRIIDIDILLYYEETNPTPMQEKDDWNGSIKITSPTLIIPHPYIKERDFVLVPLKEIL